MKCYEKLTGKFYDSSYDIITKANNRFSKTVENKLIGTIDEYFFWIIDIFNCDRFKDIYHIYTIYKKIYGNSIGTIDFDTIMDLNNEAPILIIDFISQQI